MKNKKIIFGLFFLAALLLFSCAQNAGKKIDAPDWKTRVAYHEAGHALMAALDPLIWLQEVAFDYEEDVIVGGNTIYFIPYSMTTEYEYLAYLLQINLAGYLAEEITFGNTDETIVNIFGNCYRGDVRNVIIHAYQYVKKDPAIEITESLKITQNEKKEMNNLILSIIPIARETLQDHKKQLQAIAEALIEKGTLTGDEVREIIINNPIK